MTRLAELRALLAKATPGPWRRTGRTILYSNGLHISCLTAGSREAQDVADAELIATMRDALPALLDVVEKASALLAVLPVLPTKRIDWHADELDAALARLEAITDGNTKG